MLVFYSRRLVGVYNVNCMNTIFVLLFLVSLGALVLMVIKPSLIFRNESVSRRKAGAVFGVLTLLFFILTGVAVPLPQSEIASSTTENMSPTALQQPTATSTATSRPTSVSAHGGVFVKVVNVVDGDTIKIETGEIVRYIGIDTPETVHPDKPVQCYGKEASDKNTEFVEGKTIELEKDVSEKDKYGRLLRYIWLGDVLINEVLVREGYAQSSTYPPDVKYQEQFVEAQRLAREEKKGLWGSACVITPTPKPTLKPTQSGSGTTSSGGSQSGGGAGSYVCNCNKTCSQMSSCAEAQYQLNVCGCARRDADGDGVACDSDCQ